MAERIRAAVSSRPVADASLELAVSLSLGIACSVTVGLEPDVLIQVADQALYRAKELGRNQVAS